MHAHAETLSCPTTRLLTNSPIRSIDEPDELIGHTLAGKFTLIDAIGEGAYGRVYRAEQTALHRDVAIKVLDPTLVGVPAFAERFCREAFAASRVHHPNAVTILDFARTDDGLFFLVMEYVDGLTLTQLIRQASPLPLVRVIDIMAQTLLGMEAIHDAGIIHADLKCDNIMVQRTSSGEFVKVVDFGIARFRDAVAGRPHLALCPSRANFGHPDGTEPAAHITGTPGYVAPEVIDGEPPSHASDVYAAGVVLHRLLTGRSPFSGRGPIDVLRQQLAGLPSPPSHLRRATPPAFDALVLAAVTRYPEDRIPNIRAYRQAFQDAVMRIAPGALPYCVCIDECRCPLRRCG